MSADADVVVVGTGAAGLAAAVAAAHRGAQVVALERGTSVGGTTAKAGGGISSVQLWAPANRHMRAAGLADPRADALRYMARVARPSRYDAAHATLGLPRIEYDLIAGFYDHAAPALEELEALGALETLDGADAIDYAGDLPENRAPHGRALRIMAPDGGAGHGTHLVEGLARVAAAHDVRVRTGVRVVDVLTEDGAVRGVRTEAGERIRAGAVVFASGGFGHDPELLLDFARGPLLGSAAAETNVGDFVRIAMGLGAALGNMNEAWLAPVVLDDAPHARSLAFRLPGDGMLVVNPRGVRVVNEKAPYNELTRACWTWDAGRGTYPNLVLCMVYDDTTRRLCADGPEAPTAVGGGNPIAGDPAHVITAPTLPALAAAIDARLGELATLTGGVRLAPDFTATFQATVARFDAAARSGVDPDFGRGDTQTERERTGPAADPASANPTLRPLDPDGPYHAVLLGPASLDTKGGARISPDGEVLRPDGSAIPGLYGAGNCIASPTGQGYWGGGATLGPALTFGVRAGRHAAMTTSRELQR